jgi:hypothetical protein
LKLPDSSTPDFLKLLVNRVIKPTATRPVTTCIGAVSALTGSARLIRWRLVRLLEASTGPRHGRPSRRAMPAWSVVSAQRSASMLRSGMAGSCSTIPTCRALRSCLQHGLVGFTMLARPSSLPEGADFRSCPLAVNPARPLAPAEAAAMSLGRPARNRRWQGQGSIGSPWQFPASPCGSGRDRVSV